MDPRSVVISALSAFNDHDLEHLMSHFAEDYRLVVHSRQPFSLSGRDEARAVFAHEFAEAADRRSEIRRLVVDGPIVLAECSDTLTHPLLGPLTVPIAMVFEVRDGKIAVCDYYQDTAFWQPQTPAG